MNTSMDSSEETTVDPVREFILGNIAAGMFRPGSKLPTERELAERFSKPRNAVRKALASLEFEGRILRDVGRGTFVAPASDAAHLDGTHAAQLDISPADLIEARLALEPQLCASVVTNATSSDFRRMDRVLKRVTEAQSVNEFEQWDSALHDAIASATHNRLLIMAFQLLAGARSNSEWGRLKRHSANVSERAAYNDEHREIIRALKLRDANLARNKVIEHLLHVRRNMLGH